MSSITVKDVYATFKLRTSGKIGVGASSEDFHALKGVNLQLEKGDRVALLGHNGAGKTTLLKILAGILPPSRGEVVTDGQITAALTLSLGMLNEASCLENIRLSGYYHGLDGEELEAFVTEVRDRADIDRFLHQPVKTLSRGMRSRLVVAMVLVAEAQILVFDEWIGAVDKNQLHGESTLSDAIKRSDIFIVASHKLVLIEKYCNRCLILDHGKIIHDLGGKEGVALYKQIRPSTVGITEDE